MARRPFDSCPRCGSTAISAERVRPLGGESDVLEAYVRCPKCHKEARVRLTTDLIEHQLRRFNACARRIEHERMNHGRPSAAAVSALDNEADKLRTMAVRAGLASEVAELCRLS